MNGGPHYPNLEHCEIIRGATSTGTTKPPIVTISAECLEAMDAPLPELYDFRVEKIALDKMKNRRDPSEVLAGIVNRSKSDATKNLTSFQKEGFKKMKSITDAPDDVCASILSKNGFKLNDAIERYYRGER